jgi:hypothetical protein
MIHRIAIYCTDSGQRVFDHYATPEEMKWLRVNADGKVEIADVDPCTTHVFYGWLDASFTHEVEWGFVWHDGKVFYENDIIARNYGNPKPIVRVIKRQDDPRFALFVARYISGETNSTHDINMHELNVYFNVIGNIHENPELIHEGER